MRIDSAQLMNTELALADHPDDFVGSHLTPIFHRFEQKSSEAF
jgi:hypothetical protein